MSTQQGQIGNQCARDTLNQPDVYIISIQVGFLGKWVLSQVATTPIDLDNKELKQSQSSTLSPIVKLINGASAF